MRDNTISDLAAIQEEERLELAWAYRKEMERLEIIAIAADLVSKVKGSAIVDEIIDECYIREGWRPSRAEVAEAIWD